MPTPLSSSRLSQRHARMVKERVIEAVLFLAALVSVFTTVGIVYILVKESVVFFQQVSIVDFLTDTQWTPLFDDAHFGIMVLLSGTLTSSVVALAIAIPLGTIIAIYLSEFAPFKVREIVKPFLELLGGVPTIVYGFFALLFVTPILQWFYPALSGFNLLSAGIVMGIMIIPYVSSISEDAMRAVPMNLREGSYAMGATRFQTATRVVVPAAFSGIASAYILGISRAVGETMILAVAAGMQPNLTFNPLEPAATIKRRRELATLIVRSRRGAQALPYGVAVLNADFRLDWCNDSAREHLSLELERDRNQPIVNVVRSPEFVEYLHAADFAEPLRLGSPDGRRTLTLQIVSFGDEERLLLSQDVTGTERVEAMRRDFVANVSHELRTPLTVLAGFLETIQDLKLDAHRICDYVGMMASQAERMKRLIDDLLTLSALEHAPPPPDKERVLLLPLLQRVRTEAEALSAGKHRVALEFAGAHDLLGAEHELASALTNLASNAVRYTPAGGEIRLRWMSTDGGGEFSVEDSGIGIDPEHLHRLTERFYRVDRGRSRETGGTGLGLSIVKHALARHQAALAIDSTLGKGSRFSARFPAARLARAAQKVTG